MVQKSLKLILLAAFVLVAGIKFSYAGEVDILLQKLVEKGVLTAGEAQEIKVETQEEVKKEIAQGKSASLPKWVQNTKLKGDFRLRYQDNHDKGAETDRDRARFRLRLGLESKVNEQLLVAFGIASGKTGDPRSTNQSFQDSFDKKPVIIDYAYATYTPFSWATLIGGKMKNPCWEPGDLVWDTDITPEGGAVVLTTKFNDKLDLFLTTGIFLIDETSSTGNDPLIGVIQPGFNYKVTDSIALKGAFSFYDSNNIKNNAIEYGGGTNTKKSGSSTLYAYEYNAIFPAFEISVTEPLKGLNLGMFDVPYACVFGEYVLNSLVEDNNSGYMLGGKIGYQKIEGWGQWQLRYNFARLEKDAVPDFLPDSDRYGGKTNIRGHEIMFDFGLAKNTWLGLDIYRVQSLSDPRQPETLVQVDWNLKF